MSIIQPIRYRNRQQPVTDNIEVLYINFFNYVPFEEFRIIISQNNHEYDPLLKCVVHMWYKEYSNIDYFKVEYNSYIIRHDF